MAKELHAKKYLKSLRLPSATGTFSDSHRCWHNLAPVMKAKTRYEDAQRVRLRLHTALPQGRKNTDRRPGIVIL